MANMALKFIDTNISDPDFSAALKKLLSFDDKELSALAGSLEDEGGFTPGKKTLDELAEKINVKADELGVFLNVFYFIYLQYRKEKINTEEFVDYLIDSGIEKLGFPESIKNKKRVIVNIFSPKPKFEKSKIKKAKVEGVIPFLTSQSDVIDLRVLYDLGSDEIIGSEPVVIISLNAVTSMADGSKNHSSFIFQTTEEGLGKLINYLREAEIKLGKLKTDELPDILKL